MTLPKFLVGLVGIYLLALVIVFFVQRQLLYFPTHYSGHGNLAPWTRDGLVIGYAREVPAPRTVWLLLHGNGGQAADRTYALSHFSREDSVYVLEYPGYGLRPGSPTRSSIDQAALEGYEDLRARFPGTPIGVFSESIGSGPGCVLAGLPLPPDRMTLVVPFDRLSSVAAEHFSLIPAGLLLRDRWDNIAALASYCGPVKIYGARQDQIIPIHHARALAAGHPGAEFIEIPGGHNDWSESPQVAP
ncbi:MAG TPA: alpha/beta hydrolase [Opitutaceae bacterium]|jgi:hypothetical protein